jgi:hypothetical protein
VGQAAETAVEAASVVDATGTGGANGSSSANFSALKHLLRTGIHPQFGK